jgi:potassium-transporting ATPase KdpC subunit
MKTLLTELRISALLTAILAVVLCVFYPAAVWVGGRIIAPAQADGSLITGADGTVRGSRLLAQNFTAAKYFHPRPSAAGLGYDAANSSGTNLGPTSQKLADAIKAAVAAYRTENRLAPAAPVPADAVTSSASGLDPHISPANARLQAGRVAHARGLTADRVLALVTAHTEGPDLGLFGEPRVNVLLLNLELDRVAPTVN